MTETPHTEQPITGLAATCEAARRNAHGARAAYRDSVITFTASLILQALPEAAAITIDASDGHLHEVRDASGKPLYQAPFTPVIPLHDGIADQVRELFRDLLSFTGPADDGWETASEGMPYLAIPFPGATESRRREAHGVAALPGRMLPVHAEYVPGDRAFIVDAPHPPHRQETRDRVRAAIRNSGYDVPGGTLTVTARLAARHDSAGADLALAITALGAAGACDPDALSGVGFTGELGLDGRVRPVPDINEAVRTAYANGCHTLIVADDDLAHVDVAGIGIYGVENLRQAVSLAECLARS